MIRHNDAIAKTLARIRRDENSSQFQHRITAYHIMLLSTLGGIRRCIFGRTYIQDASPLLHEGGDAPRKYLMHQ